MEKIIQEFRIIETDDGFRIEIKGDKEQLRDFVMNLDPRNWGHHRGMPWGPPPPFWGGHRGRHGKPGRPGRGFAFGPMGAWFGFGNPWEEEDDEPDKPKREGTV
jgi:hypothetical protein